MELDTGLRRYDRGGSFTARPHPPVTPAEAGVQVVGLGASNTATGPV